jgi:hypothetical protein
MLAATLAVTDMHPSPPLGMKSSVVPSSVYSKSRLLYVVSSIYASSPPATRLRSVLETDNARMLCRNGNIVVFRNPAVLPGIIDTDGKPQSAASVMC